MNDVAGGETRRRIGGGRFAIVEKNLPALEGGRGLRARA